MSIEDNLKDIDFRTREQRQKQATTDFIGWYEELVARQAVQYSAQTQGQLTMLSSVLWYLLPKNDYKKLVTMKLKKLKKTTQLSLKDTD